VPRQHLRHTAPARASALGAITVEKIIDDDPAARTGDPLGEPYRIVRQRWRNGDLSKNSSIAPIGVRASTSSARTGFALLPARLVRPEPFDKLRTGSA